MLNKGMESENDNGPPKATAADEQSLFKEEPDKLSPSSEVSQPPLETSTSDETTQRTRRKRRLGDLLGYCTCPVCGVTVRPHELEAHLQQEAKQLDKIPKQVSRHAKDIQASSSSYTKLSSSPLSSTTSSPSCNTSGKRDSVDNKTTPASRTEIFGKVKSNRNCRLNARTVRQEYRDAVCPVCHKQLQGTSTELNRHAESCLRKRDAQGCSSEDEDVDVEENGEEEDFGEEEEEYQWGGQTRVRVISLLRGNFEACGFTTVKPSDEDDEDLNVDGDDNATYGQPQYNESDIIPCFTDSVSKEDIALRRALTTSITRSENDSVGESGGRSSEHVQSDQVADSLDNPNDLTTNGVPEQPSEGSKTNLTDPLKEATERDQESTTSHFPDKHSHSTIMEGSLLTRSTDQHLLIAALRQQIDELRRNKCQSDQNILKCLICMDPYSQPVVSVICWHVYCEECWLRTLGAKKLCPQCNTITSATDLRKIYM